MAAAKGSSPFPVCNLEILDSMTSDSSERFSDGWKDFCLATETVVGGAGDSSITADVLVVPVRNLYSLGLESLMIEHFLCSVEEIFEKNVASMFWRHFDVYDDPTMDLSFDRFVIDGDKHSACFSMLYSDLNAFEKDDPDKIQDVLLKALEEVSCGKQYLERCLLMLVHHIQACKDSESEEQQANSENFLISKFRLIVSSVLLANLPRYFPDILRWYFKGRLEEINAVVASGSEDEVSLNTDDKMNLDFQYGKMMTVDGHHQCGVILGNEKLVKNVGEVIFDLRNLGFTSLAEDAYASAMFLLLKAKVQELAGDEFRFSVLESIKRWIQDVPLQFVHALLAYLGDSDSSRITSCGKKSPLASSHAFSHHGTGIPSEVLVRWQLRLEYFAYETLQDLRIAKLFEIIVDYPESSPAIEDLKQCLEHTGQHSKLVDCFIASLKYRLLTAGASTNDILHQYVSTIKALRTIDPAGIFLEVVGEPIREYLKGRKDTIKCIVTMLTDGNSGDPNGNAGDSLLEELNRDEENQENSSFDDDINIDDKQAWINSQNWEPDPVEADPWKGGRYRRKADILGMIVGIIGSKDQLVNEYRVMLAEKLLNKSDYDIDSEIRTLELLKIHFGESSMQKCEIMLNDLIDSKRTNTNIQATVKQRTASGENELSLDKLSATIFSSNFWPPIQEELLNVPEPVDRLLSDYAIRYNEIKTPRKLLWKKNLGTVKLELELGDRVLPFTVTPLHASIICQFEEQTSWSPEDLAGAVGVPVDVLKKRIYFWINKGILSEGCDETFTLVEASSDGRNGGAADAFCEELSAGDEEHVSVASAEEQLHKEMTVFEKFIAGMLTNFGSMALERIHNTLKMFCLSDPPYDKTLQQLQSFLGGLVAEDKLQFKNGMYALKR